ncbi:MAG: hypothetical protein ACC655_09535 [Rhodothermia bacterium]
MIWISDIMLRQTPIDQALPYFNRFVSVVPDAQSLASADFDEVQSERMNTFDVH